MDSQTPSVDELNRIFEIVQHHYGSYNHHRAQRSLQALEEFPVFTNATSITTTLYQIQKLQDERIRWSILNPTPPQVLVDYRFSEQQLKETLFRLMKPNEMMKQLWLELREKQHQLTYANMCFRFNSFAINVMTPEEEQEKYARTRSESLKKEGSTASSSREEITSNINAMAATDVKIDNASSIFKADRSKAFPKRYQQGLMRNHLRTL